MRDMQQQLIDTAAAEGLEMRLFENVHTNTIDAHRLLHLALETRRPRAPARRSEEALLASYFARAEDVGDHAVLTAVAVGRGLDADQRRRGASPPRSTPTRWPPTSPRRARTAPPACRFFVVDQKFGVSGAQPSEVFAQVLEQAWNDAHPVLQTVGGDADACGPDGCAI